MQVDIFGQKSLARARLAQQQAGHGDPGHLEGQVAHRLAARPLKAALVGQKTAGPLGVLQIAAGRNTNFAVLIPIAHDHVAQFAVGPEHGFGHQQSMIAEVGFLLLLDCALVPVDQGQHRVGPGLVLIYRVVEGHGQHFFPGETVMPFTGPVDVQQLVVVVVDEDFVVQAIDKLHKSLKIQLRRKKCHIVSPAPEQGVVSVYLKGIGAVCR